MVYDIDINLFPSGTKLRGRVASRHHNQAVGFVNEQQHKTVIGESSHNKVSWFNCR